MKKNYDETGMGKLTGDEVQGVLMILGNKNYSMYVQIAERLFPGLEGCLDPAAMMRLIVSAWRTDEVISNSGSIDKVDFQALEEKYAGFFLSMSKEGIFNKVREWLDEDCQPVDGAGRQMADFVMGKENSLERIAALAAILSVKDSLLPARMQVPTKIMIVKLPVGSGGMGIFDGLGTPSDSDGCNCLGCQIERALGLKD